jgi:hypothetical protein
MQSTQASRRLAKFKKQAEASKHNTSWQWYAQHAAKFGPGYNRYSMHKQYLHFHCDIDDLPGYRLHKESDSGWYADDYQNETITGIVGVFRWGSMVWIIPGVQYSDADCDYFDLSKADTLEPCEAFDNTIDKTTIKLDSLIRSNLWYANQIAERTAEEDREARQEEDRLQLLEDLTQSIKETRGKALQLIKEIKQHGVFSSAICEALRASLLGLLHHMRECKAAKQSIELQQLVYAKFYKLV